MCQSPWPACGGPRRRPAASAPRSDTTPVSERIPALPDRRLDSASARPRTSTHALGERRYHRRRSASAARAGSWPPAAPAPVRARSAAAPHVAGGARPGHAGRVCRPPGGGSRAADTERRSREVVDEDLRGPCPRATGDRRPDDRGRAVRRDAPARPTRGP
ncbi:hypothetical protein FXF53_08120 [Micromonospora sp. WP24]|nr:hypothetical protein FXF53_08120 [Micromonospora sp. WP24]